MILNTKRIYNYFWRIFRAFKSFICCQEKATATAFELLHARQIVIVGKQQTS